MVSVDFMMDPEEKKKISNEKRLKAIKEWKKNQTVQKIKPINSHKVLDTDVTYNASNKPKLFESDGEEQEDKFEDCFKVRPQFEGRYGQELLEMSSQLSGRFKLDERFKDDDEPEPQASEEGEKEKNIKILQSVLGYEVLTKKASDKSSSKKRQIRFDPDDENASKYVKTSDGTPKGKSKKSKKEIQEDKDELNIPISTERYIEVSSNLKEILSTPSAPFSLTQQFNQVADSEMTDSEKMNDASHADVVEEEIRNDHWSYKNEYKKSVPYQEQSFKYFVPKMKRDYFFIKEGDPRLKEGVEFFRRPKPLSEIREEWYKKREFVLELFRRKKRSGQRSNSTKVKTVQLKNAIRKQNFNK